MPANTCPFWSYARPADTATSSNVPSCLLRNIGEGPVTVVMKDQVSNRVELVGMAIGTVPGFMVTAIDVRAEVPLHIPADDEIEMAIAIVIHKTRARAPSAAAHSRLRSHIGE